MKPKTINLIQLNTAVLLWGGTAMFGKGISLPALHITCFRSFIAAGALAVFLLIMRQPVRIRSVRHYGVMAALGFCLCMHWALYFMALKISTAAVAILAIHTYPVITALIEPFLFREKLKGLDVLLAVLVFSGVAIMTPSPDPSNATTRGILLGIASGLFFMVRNLLTRKYVQQYSSSMLMFWQVLVTGVLLLPVVLVDRETGYVPRDVGLLFLLGIVFTALPHTLFSASFRHLSAKTVGVLATLLPLYAGILGYFIHGETVTWRTLIGGAVILGGIVFETLRHVGREGASQLDET
ncbi:MAG: DMT family transporter [Planctomycetota bacterium]|nr:MAG: DMT family transporter [Planctomycetota bacterium]